MAAAKTPASWQPELQKTWSAAAGGCVTSIALSSQGKVAVSTKSSVLLFDPPPSFGLKKQISGGSAGITASSFTTKGNDVVSGGADGFLKWWQVDTGDEVCCTQFPQSEGAAALAVQEVACSPAGFVAATSGRLLCLFTAGGEHLHTLGADSGAAQLQQLSWLGDSEVLACSGEEVTVWHVSQDQYKELRTYAATNKAPIRHIATSPNGRFIAAACDNGVVQVWDTQDEESMDPLLNIADGFDAEVMELAWDANSRLLAAAAGSDVLVWDVLDIHDGKIESYVCIGFDQGASVTCLAFHPSGELLASAADNGQCLVHDMTAFDSNGVVDGLVNNVAAANVSESEKSPDPVKALVWHGTSLLLVGTEQGHVLSLQINKQQAQQQAQAQPAQAQAAQPQQAAQAQPQPQQPQPAQPQQAQSQQQQPQPERSNSSFTPKYKGQDVRRQHTNGPDASGGSNGSSHWARSNRQQGWGGEPLANSSAAPDGQLESAPSREGSLPSGRNRGGRNREARMQGGAHQGSYRSRDSPVPPVPAGAADSPVAQEGATAVVPTPWGMVPAVPAGMPPMWMPRPGMMPGMAMPYPIAYQQMIPTAMGPMPPHMAAAQGMAYVPAPAAMQPAAAAAAAAGRYSPSASGVPSAGGGGGNSSSRAGAASWASPAAGGTGGGRNGRADRNQQQQQPQHSSYSPAPPMANGPAGSAPPTAPHTPNAAAMGAANAAAAAAAAAAVGGPPDGRRGGGGPPVPGPVPPPGPAPPSAYEYRGGPVPAGSHSIAVPPPGSRGGQAMYGPGPGGPDGPMPAGMMPHQPRYAGGPGGWTPHTPMGGDRGGGGYSEAPPQQQQQQQQGPQHQRGGSSDMGASSGGYGPRGVPPHYADSRAGGGEAPSGRGLPPPHMDSQGPTSSRSGSFSGRGGGGGGMQRGGEGFNGGPVPGGPGFYERQPSGSSREGRSSRRAAEREAAAMGGPPGQGQGQSPYQGGGSYPSGGPSGPEGGPPQQHMPGQPLHAQLPRPSGGSGSSQGQQPQPQPMPMQQQHQQQQQYVSRHPGPSSTSTGPHAPAGQEQQLRTVGSYGGPPRHAAGNGSGGHGHPQGLPPVAAGGSAADSGSAAATPRSPAAAAMAPTAMPGGAVMMAPRPMALHPAGFWMYPTPGAAAQWPAMAYPQHWAPYAAAYGYYPFQPHPAMAAVPSPAAAVPVAAGPTPAAAGAGGSSGGGGGGRSSRSGRGQDSSGQAANAGQDGGQGYPAAGPQGGGSGGGRMSGGGGGYDSSGMDPQQQQQHMMRGMPHPQQQPHPQYMQLQQQGSGGPGGYVPVGSPVAAGGGGGPPGGPDPNAGPNRTLYVGNLAASVDEQALQQQFGSYGPIANIQVMRDRDTKAPRGFAFVTYVDAADAEAAMVLHGAAPAGAFQGRALRVSASARSR